MEFRSETRVRDHDVQQWQPVSPKKQLNMSEWMIVPRYIGFWDKGVKSGAGKMLLSDGSRYEVGLCMRGGMEIEGCRSRERCLEIAGTVRESITTQVEQRESVLASSAVPQPTARRYQGDWVNDLRHGEGQMSFPSEEVYKLFAMQLDLHLVRSRCLRRGQWNKGHREGEGEAVYADGSQ